MPGVNKVTMGLPFVSESGAWKFVKIPFYTEGAEWSKDATWFIPTSGSKYNTKEELANKMASELISVYSLVVPDEKLVDREFNSFEELITEFNKELPENLSEIEFEIVMCYGKPNKGKSYLQPANRDTKDLAGRRWIRRVDSDTAPLTWNEDFEEKLTETAVPEKKVTVKDDDDLDI